MKSLLLVIADYSAIVNYSPRIYDKSEVNSMITFEPLWETMKEKNISQYSLIKDFGFSTGTLDALRKNKSVTLNTLNDICNILDCSVEDVIKFTKDME